jgi:hypothetical protein
VKHPPRLGWIIRATSPFTRGRPLTSQGSLISDIDSGLDTLLLGVEIVLEGESTTAASRRRVPHSARHAHLRHHNVTPSLASFSPVLTTGFLFTGAHHTVAALHRCLLATVHSGLVWRLQ